MELTDEIKKALIRMTEEGSTDSDIYDFCEENKVPHKEADIFLAMHEAPERCKECEYVCFRPSMPPCTGCKRNYKKDFFKKRTGKETGSI